VNRKRCPDEPIVFALRQAESGMPPSSICDGRAMDPRISSATPEGSSSGTGKRHVAYPFCDPNLTVAVLPWASNRRDESDLADAQREFCSRGNA
jgi:hypothetical protein